MQINKLKQIKTNVKIICFPQFISVYIVSVSIIFKQLTNIHLK